MKQGWCWPAFFFGFFWTMFAKMWVLGSSLLIAFFILGITSALSGESESMEGSY
ncbi:MAG: DUF2628 domain-containing protein [Methylococcales symbiont of Iophon sp. n. MRB-2018]|nr:MAG: DUF2628 domain-containing protein [Methylococcales symbiont of Iophon sp. n. MRB-2018]